MTLRIRRAWSLLAVLVAVPLCVFAAGSAAQSRYTVIDLGTLGGAESQACAINNRQQVVGESTVRGNFTRPERHAFLWEDNQMKDLGVIGDDTDSGAFGINDRGIVLGYSAYVNHFSLEAASTQRTRICLWHSGRATELTRISGPPEARSFALNDAEQVIGKQFKWEKGAKAPLGPLAQNGCQARAINARGEMAGQAQNQRGRTYAFLWSNDRVRNLGTLGGDESAAYGINNLGQVVGCSMASERDASNRFTAHAFLWENDQMSDLGALAGQTESCALSVNDRGQVVGTNADMKGKFATPTCALLWEKGKVFDLNTLIPAGTGWSLEVAAGINNSGQIVGYGKRLGKTRAFLLNPVGLLDARGGSMPRRVVDDGKP